MTAVTPGMTLGRTGRFARLRDRLELRARTRTTSPRTPAYLVLCSTVAVLNIVGLVMILSASSVAALSSYGSSWYFFNRQFAWALLGAGAFAAVARVDYHAWRRFGPLVFAGTCVLLVAVLVPGIGIFVDGSRRWLGWGPMRFQPSELAKVALVLLCADVLARRSGKLDEFPMWRPAIVVCGALSFLVVLEPDLDSTIVLGAVTFVMLVAAGVRARHLAALAGAGVAASVVLALAAPYRRARVFTFLDPWADTSNTGYQIAQSLIALGSGGIDGVGLGSGRAKWLFLPNAHTDFIFAIIGEELGLVGCLLVLGLFATFGFAGLHVARHAPDLYGTLLAVGITTWIVGQAVINLAAVVSLLPVSGITLPFLSAGGSSLVFAMAGAGVLANVARQSAARPRAARRTRS